MLTKSQEKGIKTGVSMFALGQFAIIGLVLFWWGRMFVLSFQSGGVKPLPMVDIGGQLINRDLSPTATSWYLPGVGSSETVPTEKITEEGQFIPTQTPWVITATPEPATATPTPTSTPWFDNMYIPPVPGIAVKPDRDYDAITYAKISYYYPPYAYDDPAYEINCDYDLNGDLECEYMASGAKVFHYIGEAVACPLEYPFGTIFKIFDAFYTCRDRGGAIVRVDDQTIWLDVLYPFMPGNAYWGQEEIVKIWFP